MIDMPVNMTPEQIRLVRVGLEEMREELRIRTDDLAREREKLWSRCKHPSVREYTVMGDNTATCNDCGKGLY